MGWAGGIMARDLAAAGLRVVGLERGAPRSTAEDFALPRIRDELQYAIRMGLMQDVKRETLTFRNTTTQVALPMRRLGSFLPGDGVGGAGVHWNGLTWRWSDLDFQIRTLYEEQYGKRFIPDEMSVQDWGITYAELEPYYEAFERLAATSGRAGNLRGELRDGGNQYEAPRQSDYPLPPLTRGLAAEVFSGAASQLGYRPFPVPASNASRAYTNPDGIAFGQCQYCGFCDRFGCEANAKGSPHHTVIAVAQRSADFSLRPWSRVTRIVKDSDGSRVTGVEYVDLRSGQRILQPASIVVLSAYTFSNVHLLLNSQIGTPYDPQTQRGIVGKNYCYNIGAGATLFFEDRAFNPFIGAGGSSAAIDEFYTNRAFDRSKAGFVGGSVIVSGLFSGRPIAHHPVPDGTPPWGSEWKRQVAHYYNRAMPIGAMGSVMPNRFNYLDLDPTYRDPFGAPMLRLTYDHQENERRVARHAATVINEIAAAARPDRLNPAHASNAPYSIERYQGTHNTGGAIMGASPAHSFVNKYGQSWAYPNLFVTGGAVMPHNAAYNPTATIGALTLNAARAITSRYLRGDGQLLV
ncbi:gluconate 2-dehydrogenase flavoprotein [Paraburkholderia xenovorans LB400]|nr:gluconate 2-dehydrogenase flavoprotein [Paraburkholderia xenovorans LB400]